MQFYRELLCIDRLSLCVQCFFTAYTLYAMRGICSDDNKQIN